MNDKVHLLDLPKKEKNPNNYPDLFILGNCFGWYFCEETTDGVTFLILKGTLG